MFRHQIRLILEHFELILMKFNIMQFIKTHTFSNFYLKFVSNIVLLRLNYNSCFVNFLKDSIKIKILS